MWIAILVPGVTFRKAWLLAILPVVLLVVACTDAASTEKGESTERLPLGLLGTPNPQGLPIGSSVDRLAPNFRLRTDRGTNLTLSDLRGKPVFLNFWATWCGPCLFEMPLIQRVHDRFGDRLIVLAVNLAESDKAVKTFKEEKGLTFTAVLDEFGELWLRYQLVPLLPSTFILDEDGVVRVTEVGAFTTEEEILRSLEAVGL